MQTFLHKDRNSAYEKHSRGAWVAQLVELPTLAQVRISRFVGSSPVGSFVPLSLCPTPAHVLSLSLSKIKKERKAFHIVEAHGTYSVYSEFINEFTVHSSALVFSFVELNLFSFCPKLSEHSKEFPFLEKCRLLAVKPGWM